MKIIERPFFTTTRIDTELFSEAVKAAELGDEHVTINHNKEKLHFESKATSRTAEATINLVDNEFLPLFKIEGGSYRFKTKKTDELTNFIEKIRSYVHSLEERLRQEQEELLQFR